MRTKFPMLLVICLGIAVTMFSLSGFANLHETNPADDLESGDEVEKVANNSSAAEDGEFSGSGSNQDNIIGFIISAGSRFTQIVSLIVLLPWELANLGFPSWFAFPIGGLFQLIAGIGIIEFFSGREIS